MPIRRRKFSQKAFALAASTMMTAVSVTLAAAMLTARSQWQLYAAKSSEKSILETASYAEAQDFKHRVKSQIENLSGSTVTAAGTLTSQDLFASNPFRRVTLRGGVARTTGGGKAPLLFKKMEQDGLVGASSQQVNASAPSSQAIIIPAIWAPSNYADERKNPSALPLGKDDPFYEIDCRTSFAALSAYSPSRNPRATGATKTGFGNVIVTQTRTFPVSAFTSMDFNPQTEITLASPPLASAVAVDVGRIYAAGKVKIANTLPLTASQIIAVSGIESGLGGGASNPTNPADPSEDDRIQLSKYLEELEEIEQDYLEEKAEKEGEYVKKLAEYNGDTTHPEVVKKRLEVNREIAKLDREKLEEINELKAKLDKDGRDQIFASSSGNPSNGTGAGDDHKSGGREKGRKVELADAKSSADVDFEETSGAVGVPVEDLNVKFKEERLKSLRGTLVTEDNGGSRLVRNNAIQDINSLSAEMNKYTDCRIKFEMSAPDPVSGLRHPVIASGGVRLRADTQKPLNPDMKWVGEGEESGAPFYWVRGPNNAPGGILVFDPSKLSFSGALGSSSKTKPFSIIIDSSSIYGQSPEARWYTFVQTSTPVEGISIISKDPLYIAGDFRTMQGSLPSMLVSPEIVACEPLSVQKRVESPVAYTEIEATVVTSAPSPTRLFKKATWTSGAEASYPLSPEFSRIVGSSIVWQSSSDSESNRIETLATAPVAPILNGELAPALVPVVAEVRISASAPTTKKVGFVNSVPATP